MRHFYAICAALLICCNIAAGYTNTLENSISQTVTNVWAASGLDIIVGDTTTSNTLSIAAGGLVTNENTFIGNSTSAYGNRAEVTGSNAYWLVNGNMIVGNAGATNNTLSISGGSLEIRQDLIVNAGNELQLTSGSLAIDGNMAVDNAAVSGAGTIQFGTEANTLQIAGSNTVISSGIVFDGGSEMDSLLLSDQEFVAGQYVGFEHFSLSNSAIRSSGVIGATNGSFSISGSLLELDGELQIDGELALTDVTLMVDLGVGRVYATSTNEVDVSSLTAEVTVLPNQNVFNLTNAVLIADGGLSGWSDGDSTIQENYLLYEFAFSTNSGSLDVVSTPVDGDALSSALTYAGSEGVRAGFNGMKNTVFTRTKQLRRNLVATQHLLPAAPSSTPPTAAPDGAMGPGDHNVIVNTHLWIQYFNGEGQHDARGRSDGFTLYNSGTSLGLDRLIGDALIVGFNYTHTLSDARASGGDSLDVETYWFGAYGEWVSKDGLYIDAMAAYGSSDHDAIRVEGNYLGTAAYAGDAAGAYVDVGQYFHYNRMALSPYVGLHALTVMSDKHTETEAGGGRLIVGEDERSWVESAVGLKLRHRFDTGFGRIQTSGHVEWMHDFIQDDVRSSLTEGGAVSVDLARISPDADVFSAGLGLSWFRSEAMEIGVGYNGRFSKHYEEHTGSLMLDIMF